MRVGRRYVIPRSIVTPGLLTIDLVMALSRDSLMRPLTKLRRPMPIDLP